MNTKQGQIKQGRPGRRKNLATAILSLSLLTVMAGAAVAPALGIIKEHFAGANQLLVQMIISTPALFIVLTSLVFPKLSVRFRARNLLMFGLFLYTAGGAVSGIIDNIYCVLFFRALVGIGVGIIMPLSTGLLTFYFTKDKQDRLMGYSSAMNQMGGAVATLLSGLLATVSWRLSFLVYLMGLISVVLCLMFLPNERIASKDAPGQGKDIEDSAPDMAKKKNFLLAEFFPYVGAMLLLMISFFIFPCNFAMETAKEGIIPQRYISVIMAGMDIVAFLGGLSFVHIKKAAGSNTRLVAPLMFAIGYGFLAFIGGWAGALVGAVFIGFANGLGIPFIISTASQKAGKAAALAVMPMLSASLYLAQFLTPILLSLCKAAFANLALTHLPYCFALASSLLFAVWSLLALREK